MALENFGKTVKKNLLGKYLASTTRIFKQLHFV